MSYSVKQIADYKEKEMVIFPIRKGSKGGALDNPKGWQEPRDYDPQEFKDKNVCWVLKNFTDIDLDYPLALPIAKEILPTTEMIAGRLSNPSSHYFYRAGDIKSADYTFRGKKMMQIRNGNKYQLIEPSVHPDGEMYLWERNDEASVQEPKELEWVVGRVAGLTALKSLFPKEKGNRDESLLSLSGWFAKQLGGMRDDYMKKDIDTFLRLIASPYDENIDKAENTFLKLKLGERVKGRTNVKEDFGLTEDEMKKLESWFEMGKEEELFDPPQTFKASDLKVEMIQPRPMVFGRMLIKREVSALISHGGSGKSTYSISAGLCIANGSEKFGNNMIHESGSVWIYNREDNPQELQRRIFACAKTLKIDLSKMKHQLRYTSGKSKQIVFMEKSRDGNPRLRIDYDFAKQKIKEWNISVFIIDPLISCHKLSESDNNEMDVLMRKLQDLADETNCAILICHHTNKSNLSGSDDFDTRANASRGATAITNAVRLAFGLKTMSETEAKHTEIDESQRNLYVALRDIKSNYFLMILDAYWFKRHTEFINDVIEVGTLLETDLHLVAKARKEREKIRQTEKAKTLIPTIKSFMADNKISLHDVSKTFVASDILEGFKLEKTKHFLRKIYKKDGVSEGGWTIKYKHILGQKVKEWLVLSKTPKSPF